MSKKFCAKDAKKMTAESTGYELEDRDGNFARILTQIEESAKQGFNSIEFSQSHLFTLEMLCELSTRGFALTWVPDMESSPKPSIRISWESDDE